MWRRRGGRSLGRDENGLRDKRASHMALARVGMLHRLERLAGRSMRPAVMHNPELPDGLAASSDRCLGCSLDGEMLGMPAV
jgi:hypothetical protein